MSKKNKTRLISGVIIILLMSVIFFFSAQPGSSSDEVSMSVTAIFFSGDMIAFLNAIIRKVAHMAEYAALAVPVYIFISTFDLKKYIKFLLPLFITSFYAATDEFHQLFVEGRAGKITDVGIDTVGAILGIVFIVLLNIIINKIKTKKSQKSTEGK